MTEHWLLIAAPILGLLIGSLAAYFHRYDSDDRYRHLREAKTRMELVWLAVRGNDYRMPDLDPGMFTHQKFEHPSKADDPVTALLVRSSEEECRWYALHHLLDYWERELKHQMAMQPDAEREISRFLFDQYRESQSDAADQIQARMELHRHRDEDGMAELFTIEDPATGYKQRIQMSDRDLIRFDTDADGMAPAPVQQRIDTFPKNVLREVEQRSDALEPRA